MSWTAQWMTVHRKWNWRKECQAYRNISDKQHKAHNTWPVQCVGISQERCCDELVWLVSCLCSFLLTDNSVGDDGMKVLCEALTENTTLTKLDMGCLLWMAVYENDTNGWDGWMGNGQGMTLVMMVQLHWAMCWRVKKQCFHQSASMVCFLFVKALFCGCVLQEPWFVTCMDVGTGNEIGEGGVRALCDALTTNTTLTVLDIGGEVSWCLCVAVWLIGMSCCGCGQTHREWDWWRWCNGTCTITGTQHHTHCSLP